MHHPLTFAFGAASTTLLAAAMYAGHPVLFFLAFGTFCFVLAAIVSHGSLPKTALPLCWIVPGAILLAGSAAFPSNARAGDQLPAALFLGLLYVSLGTAAWLRARYS